MLNSPHEDGRLETVPPDRARRYVRDTNAFLCWALATDRDLPRIPRRRVDEGGYDEILTHPGARALADHWWMQVLEDYRLEL